MKKRFLSMLLGIAMIITVIPNFVFAADEPAFKDVSGSEYYAQSADVLAKLKILTGYSDGTFGADKPITRAEMAAVVCRMLGKEADAEQAKGKTSFDDVPENHWASGYINVATKEGIINGDGNGKFRPEDDIKFEEALKTIICVLGWGNNITINPADWSKAYLDIAADKQLDNNLKGSKGEKANRSDIAVMVYNGLKEDLKAPAASLKTGTYRGTKKITLTTDAKGAKIYYTTDGTTPTVDSTEYTKEISISKTGTLKAVAIRDGVLSSDVMSEDYTIKKAISRRGGGSSSTTNYTVSFNTDGGSEIGDQKVDKGNKAMIPNDPIKENYTFIGWYTSDGYSEMFDFDEEINSDITIYAKWFDENDKTDTDGDGLTDGLENTFGTDINKVDTDEDGLSDYYELNVFGYDPTSPDTDKNGVIDSNEDFDGDGLTNIEEIQNGLDPTSKDSDSDLISDWDEINIYKTNPINNDTDGDGVIDGLEIELGTDPNKAETQFESEATTGAVNDLIPVAASAKVITDADGAGTISIEEVNSSDNPLISKSIAGYLGVAYDFSTEGVIKSAEITFNYDTALGNIGDDFQPRIYYVNEETGEFEELPDQIVTNGKVVATTTHFSTYILLNKIEFDKVWDTEIKPPISGEDGAEATLDIGFVIDYSASMDDNDPQKLFKKLSKEFISKLRDEKDKATVIKFIRRATIVSELTSDKNKLNTAIDSISYDDGCGSYSGTDGSAGYKMALDELSKDESKYKYKYIIFITDGEDNGYSYNYDNLIADSIENNVVVYTIGMGSASESVLRKIAQSTNGKYYHATTGAASDDVVDLDKVFEDIQEETIDYTTDSNNDGISDYYTKLINDGKLLPNGSLDLVGATDMYGEESDDWDNDGLKNGEEIEVYNVGNKAYLKMNSNPLIKDTDGDDFSDYEEKSNGTPPMKYTDTGCTYLNNLESDDLYSYVGIANDRDIISNINAFFMCNKKDSAKNLYIEYFYDYAPEDSLNENKDKIAAAKSREIYLNYAQSFANIVKISKDICSTAEDVSKMVEGSSDTGNSKEFVDKLKDKSIKVKGASAQIRKSRKAIIDAVNSGKFEGDQSLKTLLSDTESALDIFEELRGEIDTYDVSEFTLELTGKLNSLSSIISKGIGTTKTVCEGVKYIKLDTGFKNLSKEYKNFVKSKGVDISTSTWIGVGINVMSGGIDVWENCLRYGKMKANRDAYLAYIDLLYNIAENAYDDYDKDAAREIAEIIADESWSKYESQLAASNATIIASTAFETAFDIASDANPYIAIANAVYKIAKLTISVTGLSNNAHALLNCRTSKSISDGCKYIIDGAVEKNNDYFSYDENEKEYIYSYIQQLAQSRIVGEDYAKQRMKKNDLAMIIIRWKEKTGKDDIDEIYDILIGETYSRANKLKLKLSPQLPCYSKFCNYM